MRPAHQRALLQAQLVQDRQLFTGCGLRLSRRVHEHPGGEGHVDAPPAPLEAFDAVPVTPAQTGLGDVVDVVGQDRHEQLVGVVGVADGQRDAHTAVGPVAGDDRQALAPQVLGQVHQEPVGHLAGGVTGREDTNACDVADV